jgi:hypothetical protein
VNVLDENIIDNQRRQLMSWRMRIHQIGFEVGRKGMKDREIIPESQAYGKSNSRVACWSGGLETSC